MKIKNVVVTMVVNTECSEKVQHLQCTMSPCQGNKGDTFNVDMAMNGSDNESYEFAVNWLKRAIVSVAKGMEDGGWRMGRGFIAAVE